MHTQKITRTLLNILSWNCVDWQFSILMCHSSCFNPMIQQHGLVWGLMLLYSSQLFSILVAVKYELRDDMRKHQKSWKCEWILQSKQKTSLDMHLATGRGTSSCWSDFTWMAGSAHWITHSTVCKSFCCFLPFPRMELKKTQKEQEQAESMCVVHSTDWHTECLKINSWSH